MANLRVGGEVDAFCTRCKLDLAHTILAMVGTKVARVRCNTCGGDHAFRGTQPASGSSRPAASKPRAAASAPRATKEETRILSFEQQLAERDASSAARYSPKETYAVDQVIQHPTFGLGIVKAVRGDKMDVAFKAEDKTLVHGRGGGSSERPAFQPPSAPRSGPADKPLSATGEPGAPAQEGEQA